MADIARIEQNARRSGIVVCNGMVYLTGQVADDKGADIITQTRQALAKVDRLLERAGSDRARLITAQIWLSSIADFDAMNSVWDAWVIPDERPTRCCGEVKLADPDYLVEVVVSAAV